MQENIQHHDWFAIWKDIIIPATGVLSTIIIGIYIAFILKNREQKEQRKILLIDTFWLFLEKKSNFTTYYIDTYTHKILDWLTTDINKIINISSNDIAKEKIWHRIKILNSRIESKKEDDINPFYITNKFSLLIGKDIYNKKAQVLLDKIGEDFKKKESINVFTNGIENKIIANNEIISGLNSSKPEDIDHAIKKLEEVVKDEYLKYHDIMFRPYEEEIEDLIDIFPSKPKYSEPVALI